MNSDMNMKSNIDPFLCYSMLMILKLRLFMLQYVPYYLQGGTPSPTDALVRHDHNCSLLTTNRDTLERLIPAVFWQLF